MWFLANPNSDYHAIFWAPRVAIEEIKILGTQFFFFQLKSEILSLQKKYLQKNDLINRSNATFWANPSN